MINYFKTNLHLYNKNLLVLLIISIILSSGLIIEKNISINNNFNLFLFISGYLVISFILIITTIIIFNELYYIIFYKKINNIIKKMVIDELDKKKDNIEETKIHKLYTSNDSFLKIIEYLSNVDNTNNNSIINIDNKFNYDNINVEYLKTLSIENLNILLEKTNNEELFEKSLLISREIEERKNT